MRLHRLYDQPYLLLTLTVLFWSGNFVLGRAVHDAVPPVGLAFWRWLGGFLLLLPFAWQPLQRDWHTLRQHWRPVLLLATLGVAAFNTLVYLGLQYTVALNALLLQSTMPVLIMLMSFLLFRETVHTRQTLGIVVSLSGVFAIVTHGDPARLAELAFNRGDLLVFTAVICYAAYSVLLRLRPKVHPLSFLAVTFALGALLLLPLYAWESLHLHRPMPLNLTALAAIGYVALFPSVLAYFCFNRGVELVGANRAGLFIHLMPVFGSLMAILFLGERFEVFHGIGILLILIGIILATRRAAHQ